MSTVLPADERVIEGLRQPEVMALQMGRLLRGSDSSMIDVAFGPVMREKAAAFAVALVRDAVQRLWDGRSLDSDFALSEKFAAELQQHHRRAVKQAKSSNRVERVQVFQLAVLKLLLTEADAELEAVREELGEARNQPNRQASGQSLEIHNRAVLLARRVGHVRYRVANQLLNGLFRLEYAELRQLRKSVLGTAWPVSESMLNNPIIQLGGVGTPCDFAANYPVLALDQEHMRKANRCIIETFAAWLPEAIGSAELVSGNLRRWRSAHPFRGVVRGLLETERRVRLLCGQDELVEALDCWLDVPENATALLGGDEADWPRRGSWFHPRIADLQKKLNRQFERALVHEDLKQPVVASYEFSSIYPTLGISGAEAIVFDHLSGVSGRRDTTRRLAGIEGVRDADEVMRRLAAQRKEYQRAPGLGKPQMLARFAGDFLRLRRDLKLAWRSFAAMDMIRLVERDGGPVPTEDGAPLLVFHGDVPCGQARDDVIGHVVVRAELRGIFELASQIQQRRIDPAARLGKQLFDRVTKTAERFDAHKIRVDSEGMLFSMLHRDGDDRESMSVARGCALARCLAEQVQAMNLLNAKEALPTVEVSIAIAYADEPPLYLYDHVRRVMVSPAIKRTRRLTLLNAGLRSECPLPGGRGLRVVLPVRDHAGDVEQKGRLARVNINGIELDGPAFAQLRSEIRLQRLQLRQKQRGRQVTLYVGECTDVRGAVLDIVVRERSIRLWMGRQLVEDREQNRRYFEVVWESSMIDKVSQHRTAALEQTAITS